MSIYTSAKRVLNSTNDDEEDEPTQTPGAGSSKIPLVDWKLGVLNQDTARDVGLTSLFAGGVSGAVVCIGSAPFELVKVRFGLLIYIMDPGSSNQVRRQLEYQIYRDSHPDLFIPAVSNSNHTPSTSHPQLPSATIASSPGIINPRVPPFSPPTTLQAVRAIITAAGFGGLYIGWQLHFLRDTVGTALYFAEYDVLRHMLGRKKVGKDDDLVQGKVPEWARSWLPKGLIPFLCGSLAGVTSWALIYPVDVSLHLWRVELQLI